MNQGALRSILKIFTPPIVPEGDGAKVMRIIGTKYLKELNPFIMLDYAKTRLPGGFPDHPHRGFETVSYLLEGSYNHEDSNGNKGILKAGDIQWMTAGKGILHSEMPGSFDEDSIGFQLWINLQSQFKMCEPQYQEIPKANIPIVQEDGVVIKLIAGEALGQKGPIYTRTPAFFMDISLSAGKVFQQRVPVGFNGLCFIYKGSALFGPKKEKADEKQVVVLNLQDQNEILQIETKDGISLILIAGEPINEPIVQHGPFVMNTVEEIQKTIEDYQQAKNGFEGSKNWTSQAAKLRRK